MPGGADGLPATRAKLTKAEVAPMRALIARPGADGTMAGIEHALPAALAIDGAESWYPVKPVGAQVNDQSRAKGERYILRVPFDGAATYHLVNAIRLINREDVTVGLGVMQGVYTIALILGFRNALEAAYPLILHPTVHHPGQIANPVLLLVLFSIMLLGLRFFWITRNLYALIIDTQLEETVAKKKNCSDCSLSFYHHSPSRDFVLRAVRYIRGAGEAQASHQLRNCETTRQRVHTDYRAPSRPKWLVAPLDIRARSAETRIPTLR